MKLQEKEKLPAEQGEGGESTQDGCLTLKEGGGKKKPDDASLPKKRDESRWPDFFSSPFGRRRGGETKWKVLFFQLFGKYMLVASPDVTRDEKFFWYI